jgi:D-alanine--poly(phosphoribitol) ligase subunit 1
VTERADSAVLEGDAHEPVHMLLRRACAEHALRVAIESGDRRITYADLLARAAQIRQLLVLRGFRGGGIVAVCGHRGVDVIAAAMAVWSCGLTLMLVDASLPEQRREIMLTSVATQALVTCGTDIGSTSLPVLDAATAPAAPADGAWTDPPDDRAYIAFTSGSTGRPKAIAGSHNGLSHFLQWQRREFAVGPADRFAHLTNLSFDVWFRDALTPLISGATLCIPASPQLGAQATFDFVRDSAITALHVVPSVANQWINTHRPQAPIGALRHAFFAGEPLEGALVRKWRQAFPACQVVNLYGPTETTLAKHFKRVAADPADGIQAVGANIPGSSTFILAEDLRPCPHGEQGEICIATPHRSHGYLTHDGIVSPFVDVSLPDVGTVSVYRTGDLGRRNDEGDIEILGRKDDQIKINGVRIELLEVKSAIASHPRVRDVFVCARQERFTKAIVAVVEADADLESELQDRLRRQFPPVMVPSRIHILAALPRLPNGKTDRRTLTDYATRPEAPAPARDPRLSSAAADRIEGIWERLLGTGNAARWRNFFEAGGNSLTIVELHGLIEMEFNVKLPLVRLFEHTTIDAQARLVEDLSRESSPAAASQAPSARAEVRGRVIAARRQRAGLGPTRPHATQNE